MPNNFFSLPKDIQGKIITSTAYKLNLSPVVVEKDLWVCWALEHLFSMKLSAPISFKGGTSLSKCYQLIRRFSEDLDITIDYRKLRKLDLPLEGYSKSFLKNLSDELKSLVRDYVYDEVLTSFTRIIKNTSDLIKIEVSIDGENLRIYYPSVFEKESHYLANSVLIEFGGRNVTDPSEVHIVRPYIADYVENLKLPTATISVLSPLRTFWEKVTLVHVECHRGRLINHPERMSRHWYDLAMLAESSIASQALADSKLMLDVIRHKQAFFNASYANYEKCLKKQFKLVPCDADLKSLEQDFDVMVDAGMFYGGDPDFSDLMNTLRSLEGELNK
ncbi:MAG: nucleotidyl transferase AbiEii/AbiGii toxin family protein [Gammaproteobacteria bacterium]|nr:nucleotidyl transferase AbiEii/AbiGii toxin family protein [Gammaproteobacteria bacterium]